MTRNPVGWFEIYVREMERARRFYEAVFDIELMELAALVTDLQMQKVPMQLDAGGASGTLVKMEGCPSGPWQRTPKATCSACIS